MKQVIIQLDNIVAEQLEITAQANGYTLAGYITVIINGHCANILKKEIDAKRILLDLIATSDPDPTFIKPSDIPWEITSPREAFN